MTTPIFCPIGRWQFLPESLGPEAKAVNASMLHCPF